MEKERTRVFVAGATGAIGRQLVPQLVAAGYRVAGTTRTASKLDGIRAAGATGDLGWQPKHTWRESLGAPE